MHCNITRWNEQTKPDPKRAINIFLNDIDVASNHLSNVLPDIRKFYMLTILK